MSDRPRVLVVDDEEPFAFTVVHKLRNTWYVSTASDGFEALTWLSEPFDLIVLDLMMPGMNGAEVLVELRKRGLTIPVAVCTNKTRWAAESDTEGLLTDADRLIMKRHMENLYSFVDEIAAKFHAGRPH